MVKKNLNLILISIFIFSILVLSIVSAAVPVTSNCSWLNKLVGKCLPPSGYDRQTQNQKETVKPASVTHTKKVHSPKTTGKAIAGKSKPHKNKNKSNK